MAISSLFSALLAAVSLAQSPTPPCTGPEYSQFDFWLGEWNVYGPKGGLAGTNSITKEEYGCLIVEKWVNTGAITGQSYNYYDPGTQKWRQVWVSGGANIDYEGGLNENGAMALEGTITNRDGTMYPFKGTWTLQEDGAVIQYFQQYDPENEVWTDWFTGRYVRKE